MGRAQGATRVSRSENEWWGRGGMTGRRTTTRSATCAPRAALAPVLLTLTVGAVAAGTGCLNPLYFDELEVLLNHAPLLHNVQPTPSFGDIEVNVGEGCAPVSFRADRVEDADLDVLTVRYSVLVPRGLSEARVVLREEELVPLDEPVDGSFYDLRPFELTGSVLRIALGGDLDEQVREDKEQLFELRISDGGFKAGTDEVRDGAALEYIGWAIKLRDTPCAF